MSVCTAHPTLASLYLQALTRYGARTAVVEGEIRHSYRDLELGVGRLLTLFDRLGWAPGTVVALAIPMGFEFLSWYIACQVGGITVLDLPPQLRPDAMRHIVEASGAHQVIAKASAVHAEAMDELRQMNVGVHTIDSALSHDDLSLRIAQCEPADLVERRALGCAAISTTSGSTGKPKALAFSADALATLSLLHMATLDYPRSPVTVVYRTSFATMALTVQPALIRGGFLVTLPSLDVEAIGNAIAAHGANFIYLTTDTIHALAEDARFAAALRKLTLVMYSGRLPPARLPALRERFGAVFVNLYGPSETNPATVLLPEDHDYSGGTQRPPVGRALFGVQVQIHDADGKRLSEGEVGEIVIKSPAQMTHYVGAPELTAQTIRDGWVRTGDLGRMTAAGDIFIIDRLSFSFVSRGRLVHPSVIDGVLLSHAAVHSCVTIGIEDPDADHRIVAAVVLREQGAVDAGELASFVRMHDPALEPHEIRFLLDLPRSPLTHKIDRTELRRLLTTTMVEA